MGKPTMANPSYLVFEYIEYEKGTWGTETSQYPEEKRNSLSSGERKGKSPNRAASRAGL